MKKVIAVILVVALAIGAFSFVMPASAEPDIKFKASIVPGAFPLDHTLEKGEVKVYNNGTFEIKVWGCKPEQNYWVNLGSYVGDSGGGVLKWSGNLATFTTDEKGAAKVSGIIPSKYSQWSIFAINAVGEGLYPNRFVSGFQTP